MTESSFDKIKKLIKVVGGKVIIVEDGKPTMVVINIDEYVDFKDAKDSAINSSDKKEIVEKVERVNKDINVWKNKQGERMLRQFEIENKYRKRKDLKDKDINDSDEIIIEKL